jgi:hypothetical protein
MSNNLDAIVPRILSAGLQALTANVVMPGLVRRDFDPLASLKGKTIDVPIPSGMGVADDVLPSNIPAVGQDLTPTYRQIKLDQWKKQEFSISDAEELQITQGYLPSQVTEAAKSLANAIDLACLGQFKAFYGKAGRAGVTPFRADVGTGVEYGLGASQEARKVLNKQLAPNDGMRRIVLDVDAEANASVLPAFANFYQSGDSNVITTGNLGMKQGFNWFLDQNVPTHTVTQTGTPTVGVLALAGSYALTVAGVTGTAKIGDLFSIAGDSQSYVITNVVSPTSWEIAPQLALPALANAAITVVPSHVANLAFHQDAIALALRPIADSTGPGFMETYTDPKTGISLRLEISRQNKRTLWCFDVLFGTGVLRQELGCRILG